MQQKCEYNHELQTATALCNFAVSHRQRHRDCCDWMTPYIRYYFFDSWFQYYDTNGGFRHSVWEFRVINCDVLRKSRAVFKWRGRASGPRRHSGVFLECRDASLGNYFKGGDVKRTQRLIKTNKNSVPVIVFFNKGNFASVTEYYLQENT
jgi:hypothetical protein